MNLESACSNFLTQIYKHFGVSLEWRKCIYYFRSGKNKGNCCQERALENGYCKDHQRYVTPIVEHTVSEKVSGKKTACKASSDIEKWLDTAVPQTKTKLRRQNGYLVTDDNNELVFTDDDNYMVIGQLNKDRIIKLTSNMVNLCEEKGWKYDVAAVLKEDD